MTSEMNGLRLNRIPASQELAPQPERNIEKREMTEVELLHEDAQTL
jgi:hypothetical protein